MKDDNIVCIISGGINPSCEVIVSLMVAIKRTYTVPIILVKVVNLCVHGVARTNTRKESP